MYVCTAEPNNV